MIYAGAGILLLVGFTGLAVVCTRDVNRQVLALSFYGLVTALMFFYFQAPDVALSQIAVGSVALPLMVMLAISRMRFRKNALAGRDAAGDRERGEETHE